MKYFLPKGLLSVTKEYMCAKYLLICSGLTDPLDMTMAVDLDVKLQTKQKCTCIIDQFIQICKSCLIIYFLLFACWALLSSADRFSKLKIFRNTIRVSKDVDPD